jgi:tetratricopeptide (TPR) repeat protein
LSAENSTELLFSHLRRTSLSITNSEKKVANNIVEELGCLPLAVAHIAGYIDQSQSSLEGFLKEFYVRRHGSEIWNRPPSAATAYYMPGTLGTVWDIAIDSLQPPTRTLLDVLSFLNPDSIPEILFADLPPEKFYYASFNQLVADLRRRHLVERISRDSVPSLSIHRSLQRNLLFKLDKSPPTRQLAFEIALSLVRAVYPQRSEFETPIYDKWAVHQAYLPQVLSLHILFQQADPPLNGTLSFASVLADAGTYLLHRGNITEGIQILYTANEVCLLFPEILAFDTRAGILQSLQAMEFEYGIGKRDLGLLHLQERVRLREAFHNANDQRSELLLSNAWHDLGCGNLECENFNAVEELLEKSLAIKKRWGSPESIPFEYAVHYEDLAYLRLSQGKTIEACELIAKAVSLLEVDETVQRDAITQFTFDWAVILLNSGEFESALEKATVAHELRKEIFGNSSAKTLHCLYWMANALFHMERFDLAEYAFLNRTSMILYTVNRKIETASKKHCIWQKIRIGLVSLSQELSFDTLRFYERKENKIKRKFLRKLL